MIVAAGTVDRHAEKGLRSVLHGRIQPDVAIALVVVAGEESRGRQNLGIRRGDFIPREHFHDHAVVTSCRHSATR